MVPKIHANGTSFKGAAAYLLHDKGKARTAERVAWTEVRGLASDDPQTAWRIMAATAMDRDRLKREAGVRNTGRKSDDTVLHYTLNWHRDEAGTLTREEMMRAANASLRALGAEDRQALIVCHRDGQPHLHIIVNRVSPTDGRMLSSSKQRLKLSKWAQAYEKERGHIWCENRVLNNDARARGEFTRAAKEMPRNILEQERQAGRAVNDNRLTADHVRAQQRAMDAALSRRGREMHAKHRQQQAELSARHKARKEAIYEEAKKSIGQAKARIREAYRPEWRALFRAQQAEARAFEERETRILGKIANVVKAMDFARQVRGEDIGAGIGDLFRFVAFAGERRKALAQMQEKEKGDLARRQDAATTDAINQVRDERGRLLAAGRERFAAERGDMLLEQRADQAALRSAWRTRSEQRSDAWQEFRREMTRRRQTELDQDNEAGRTVAQEHAQERDKAPEGQEEAQQAERTPRERREREKRTRGGRSRRRTIDGDE